MLCKATELVPKVAYAAGCANLEGFVVQSIGSGAHLSRIPLHGGTDKSLGQESL